MTKYTAGRGLGIMLIVAGIAHFVVPAGFDKIIPPALPFEPRFWTYLSGAAELTIGAMMFAEVQVGGVLEVIDVRQGVGGGW